MEQSRLLARFETMNYNEGQMKKIIWFIVIVLFLGIGYLNRAAIVYGIQNATYFSVCDSTIKYKVGTIDKRFNLTQDEFKNYIADAAEIWNTASGKQLFAYDPYGPLTLNLQYYERQSLNTQINQLDTKLDEQNRKL